MSLETEWNEILRERPLDVEALTRRQEELGLTLGGRPLCTVLRPMLVTEAQYAEDAHVAETVLRALVKACDRLRQDADLARFYLGSWLEERKGLFGFDHGFRHESVFGRMDAYRTPQGLRFLEYNAGMAGGFTAGDPLARYFRELDAFPRFAEKHPLDRQDLLPAVGGALLQAWSEWGGQGRPAIAIVASAEMLANKVIATVVRTVLHGMKAAGFDVEVADPADLSFDGKRLRQGSREVDVVLRAFLADVVPSLGDSLQPLLQALREKAVCMVNPFTFQGHKAVFDLVTDPGLDLGFTEEEARLTRQHVPWTRLVRPGATTGPDGEEVDLVRFATGHRSRLVLKSVGGMGGKDVHLGWLETEADWEAAIRRARDDRGWIVQERVAAPPQPFPHLSPGAEDVETHVDCCPLILNGRFAGYMVRLSTAEVTNVSQGGGLVPTFVVRA